ncbi:UDP-N-acetylglucosamine 1-carboxyvinyltransferase [Planosporangium mesophilum]|uniref:UDP-N-acetylglucosamine 1-carboxyvinyltransferase n=1 Tax=Planosporangium mesophilum TaxID=689768 RepID=A0A8J3WZ49_9ACTN|nr:UDP-N-acetylglucosamine 1-carboxyvinyltransferase [Planosporangium mesophilum]NJC83454.1 UDP-N-acetylglucosamine 1-carboxyvinyltransferase [Planosporangium mesophilum]GII21965.1 UDP-N-acetylglucosamine 1-carboxyvinyltransferase [Planosporangium mesophilum]
MNDVLVVHGGAPLHGNIRVRGAKNLVSKAMVAALLGDSPSRLFDVPAIRDVEVVRGLLELHGVRVSDGATEGELVLDPANADRADADEINVHAGSSRIPILLCGPLLHRLGHAFIPDLGGCNIGGRPIDFHLQALREFGAIVDKTASGMEITAPNGLHGTKLQLPYPSVGATEQVLLTAVKAEGVTELRNAAVEPEIIDLICLLQKMGAIIKVHTDRVIEIEGVKRLGGYTHRPIPDRIEAASWAAAALATKGDVFVEGARQAEMMTFLNTYLSVGGAFEVDDSPVGGGIRFWHPGGELRAVVLETDVHPGFMTDWQQPMVVALTQARGLSIMHETVYERRLGYTRALGSMGATIQVYRECLGGTPCRFGRRNFLHSAVIAGPSKLHAAELMIPDLRAGFSHLIAALAAEGTSQVHGVSLINRGYEDFEGKLAALGAHVERG